MNFFIVFASASGSGKSVSGKSPILEFPDTYRIKDHSDEVGQAMKDAVRPVKAASAQSLAAMFVELQRERKKVVQYAKARYVRWDEIDTLSAHLANKQDTMSAELRSAWSGEPMGTFTKGSENRLFVDEDCYRFVASWNAQYAQCGPLFQTAGGGFLQRMLFLKAHDPQKAGGAHELKSWAVELPRKWPDQFWLDDDIAEEVREDYRQDRYSDSENSHRNLIRLKVAAILAAMHGTTRIEQKWWSVAGAIMTHSDQVKREIREELRRVDLKAQQAIGRRAAIRDLARTEALSIRLAKVKQRIVEVLAEQEGGEWVRSRVKARLSAPQQAMFQEALDELEKELRVCITASKVRLR